MDNGHRREVWWVGEGKVKKKKGTSEEKDGGSCSTVEVIKTHKAEGGWMMGARVSV